MKINWLMSLFLTISIAAAAAVLEPRDACNANNCLRAVRATASLSRGFSDCSTYLVTTVTPTVLTVTSSTDTITIPTSTVTITSYSIIGASTTTGPPGRKAKRQHEPAITAREPAALAVRSAGPTIPTYASACSTPGAYSSACSCLGLLPRTSTFSVPPSTTTTVVGYTTTALHTVTATATAGACDPKNNYGLIYGSGEYNPPRGTTTTSFTITTTAQGCCAACYSTKGCIFYSYFESRCSVMISSGPETTPANGLCPYGTTDIDFILGAYFGGGPTGDPLALGPCSQACQLGIVGGYAACVGPYNGI